MNTRWRLGLLIAVLGACLGASAQQSATIHIRGTVDDAKSSRAISGARVSVAGARALHDDTTDNNGSFDLPLRPGVQAGERIRVRVEKEGYEPWDQAAVASDQIPLQVRLVAKGKATHGPPAQQLVTSCHLSKKQSPCELYCTIENSGLEAAHDTSVGFVGMLPTQTVLAADPEARVRLEKSDVLPVPAPEGNMWEGVQAFTIRIPIVPPRSTIAFALWTNDDNNRKACEQTEHIQQLRRVLLKKFLDAVRLSGLTKGSTPIDLDSVMSAEAKSLALYKPKDTISDRGRSPVQLLTTNEAASRAKFQEIYSNLQSQFSKVFEDEEWCAAPVYTIEQTGGKSAAVPQFISVDPKVYVEGMFIVPERGQHVDARFTPPASYGCGAKPLTPGEPANMTMSPK